MFTMKSPIYHKMVVAYGLLLLNNNVEVTTWLLFALKINSKVPNILKIETDVLTSVQ